MTAATAPVDHDRAPIELPHRERIEILIAVLLGIFLAALDQTIVGTALPRIVTVPVPDHRPGRALYCLAMASAPSPRRDRGPSARPAHVATPAGAAQ